MKSLKYYILVGLTFLFTGCFEINEELVINKNGSGTLSMKTELGKLFEMLQSFMPAEELKKSEFATAKDTVMYMKDFLDTLQSMSADKKALLRDGTIHLKMNLAEKQFMFNMSFPFKKAADIGKIYDNLGEAQAGMGQLMKGMDGEESGMKMTTPDAGGNTSFYDISAEKGRISRTVNKEKYARMKESGRMEQLKQMGSMAAGMDEIKMTTTVRLPKKAKKLTGAKAQLSSDKKTVLLKATLVDMYEHPELYEFSVKY
jgi:hypothetical protein